MVKCRRNMLIFITSICNAIAHLFFSFSIRSSKGGISTPNKFSYICFCLFILNSKVIILWKLLKIRGRFLHIIFIKEFPFIFLHKGSSCVAFEFTYTFFTLTKSSDFLISFLRPRRYISIRFYCKVILRKLSFRIQPNSSKGFIIILCI